MNKLIYLLWPLGPMDPSSRRRVLLQELAPKLLAAGATGLQINIDDDQACVPSPAPRWPWLPKPFVAQVNVWSESPAQAETFQTLLSDAGFRFAGYRVDEWLYTDYGENPHAEPRDWPDGERSPGILAVTLIKRPARVPHAKWMQRWFGWQSPMSEAMQPRTRYVRNLIEERLTEDTPEYDGIVEEDWPSGEHVTNPYLFYGARNIWQLVVNISTMLKSVVLMLPFFHITTVMMSEYFIKSPPAAGPEGA